MNLSLSACYATSIQQALRARAKGWENPRFAERAKIDLKAWKCGSSGYVLHADTGIVSDY